MAMKAVERPSYEDFLRRVQRWYSIKFTTPIREVRSMPDHEVLSEYYEETYRELYDGDDKAQAMYKEIRQEIVGISEESVAEDDDWAKQLNEEVKAQDRQQDRPKTEVEPPKAAAPQGKPAAEDRQVPEDANLIENSGFIQGETEIPED